MAVINASDQEIPLDFGLATQSRNLWVDAWHRLRRNKLAVGGGLVLLLLCVVAIAAPVIAPYSYDQTVRDPVTKKTIKNEAPSAQHWFGTDAQSRDEFSRVVYGTRISLSVGLVSQLIIIAVGIPIGLLAGYYGGLIDLVLMRITDIMYAFPRCCSPSSSWRPSARI